MSEWHRPIELKSVEAEGCDRGWCRACWFSVENTAEVICGSGAESSSSNCFCEVEPFVVISLL